jgi:predicted nucleotidyltransferase
MVVGFEIVKGITILKTAKNELVNFFSFALVMDIRTAIQNYFKSQPVSKAYLFGSYARGEQDEKSDIDLLVELESKTNLFTFIKMKNELEALLQKPVDLVSSKAVSKFISPFIEKDKILVYEK